MDIELHPINRGDDDNGYCGPAVVSFLTGENTSAVAKTIKTLRGAPSMPVTGTWDNEIVKVLELHGLSAGTILDFSHLDRKKRPTLAAILNDREPYERGETWLIAAGNHWQLVQGDRYACGRIGEVTDIRDKRVKRRARVRRVYSVQKFSSKFWLAAS